ncbi:MAG TPA: NHLP-related RiPP peptide [Lysobacter sp.]|nr:NHLP-related RiPP peptide [Lysobacter sp.]
MTNLHDGSGHPPLDPNVADKLLELLSTDDEFRTLFKQDAEKALSQVGYFLPAGAPSLRCTQVEHLASKDEVAESREALKSHLTATGPLTVIFCFEAGKVSSFLRSK